MSKRTRSMIGHDPLAWINEPAAAEETAPEEVPVSADAETPAETPAEAEPVPPAAEDSGDELSCEAQEAVAEAAPEPVEEEAVAAEEPAESEVEVVAEQPEEPAAEPVEEMQCSSDTESAEAAVVEEQPDNTLCVTDTTAEAESMATDNVINIDLGDALGIADVSDLYEQLSEALKNAKDVVFQAGDLEVVDSAALQLLVAYHREAPRFDLTVRWEQQSEALRQAATTLGLTSALGLEKAA